MRNLAQLLGVPLISRVLLVPGLLLEPGQFALFSVQLVADLLSEKLFPLKRFVLGPTVGRRAGVV